MLKYINGVIRSRKWKMDNDMVKRERTTQKTKDRAIRAPLVTISQLKIEQYEPH